MNKCKKRFGFIKFDYRQGRCGRPDWWFQEDLPDVIDKAFGRHSQTCTVPCLIWSCTTERPCQRFPSTKQTDQQEAPSKVAVCLKSYNLISKNPSLRNNIILTVTFVVKSIFDNQGLSIQWCNFVNKQTNMVLCSSYLKL